MDASVEIAKKRRLRLCLCTNFGLLALIVVALSLFGDPRSPYLRYGPSSELEVLGVKVDTWERYVLLQLFLAFLEVTDVVVNEIASPILGFNIYNPDKVIITEFSRLELQFYANSMWILNALKGVMMVVVSISQIDIAILRVLYGQITSFYTIRMLLKEKEFPRDDIGKGQRLITNYYPSSSTRKPSSCTLFACIPAEAYGKMVEMV